ncbi:MAG: hypothetical protein Q9219_005917 [cf. Caloplaca sp. 3 TL-2023]
MSRHKLVKTMDLDDELDDFEGVGYDDDYDESAESRLQKGLLEVRMVLGPSVSVSDKDIEDSLWHYYYDADKTVNYLLRECVRGRYLISLMVKDQRAPAQPKTIDNKNELSRNGKAVGLSWVSRRYNEPCFRESISMGNFFSDAPWFNIPSNRQGEILIEPLYPRGRLLGGSSNQGGPKMSKLAALAAARKKKENQKSNSVDSQGPNSSVALLERLKDKTRGSADNSVNQSNGPEADASLPVKAFFKRQTQEYASKRRESSPPINHEHELSHLDSPSPEIAENAEDNRVLQSAPIASPSAFAKVIFGSSPNPEPPIDASFQTLTLSVLQARKTDAKPDAFTGPSPDDIVTKAQNSSKGGKAAKKISQPSKDDPATGDLPQGIAAVAIDEGPKPRSKNLDVLAEYHKSEIKHAANFVVIGHVDAGKSTLMGRLLYDLKVVDQRTIDKYRKEAEKIGKSSFALAWVLDQGTEERDRGVTIDIAMNKFDTSKTSFTILDAPGHRDFIPNMIAGASQADFAVLVIDASTGSFESGLKGQTKEHALLVRSMGVQRIVIAVNKLDTVEWSKDRFDEIRQQVSAFLTTAGFQARNIAFVPCSGLTGENVAQRADNPKASWYDGPILVEQLEAFDPATRALDKPLRLTIADIFRGGVQNPLSVSGRLEGGTLQVGDRIIAMPANETAIIKGVEVDFEPADWAVAGQNVVLHLTDIEQKHLRPGDVICPSSAPITNIKTFTTKILAFDHIMPMHIEVHRGRLHVPGRITQLLAVLDKGTGTVIGKKKPKLVQPGAVARVVVEIERPAPLEAPGRVVLRAGGETVAAGLLE